jgi:hypothetical protein
MKKALIIGLPLLIIVAIVVALPFVRKLGTGGAEPVVVLDSKEEIPQEVTGELVPKIVAKGEVATHKVNVEEERSLSEEELEELNKYFDKVENEWDKMALELFTNEMGLPRTEYEEYKKIRDSYEQDKLEAYQEYHEYMVEKHGESYAYSPSEDMEAFENKVKGEYLEILRKRVGDKNYIRYTEVIDGYNEKLRREQDPTKGVMLIDF